MASSAQRSWAFSKLTYNQLERFEEDVKGQAPELQGAAGISSSAATDAAATDAYDMYVDVLISNQELDSASPLDRGLAVFNQSHASAAVTGSSSPRALQPPACARQGQTAASAPGSAPTEARDWNAEYQLLQESPVSTPLGQKRRAKQMKQLVDEFVAFSLATARVLVAEFAMENDQRTIRSSDIGGIAGGRKYCHGGVLFKFATDDHRIYGSELAAQKAAGNEIRAMNAIIDLNVAHLHTTLSAMFLLRGHCVYATALAPLRGSDTLVYGSADAGRTVKDCSPALRALIARLSQGLNLKPHVVRDASGKDVTMCVAADVEGHRSADGRFYLCDLSRLLPCQPPRSVIQRLGGNDDVASTTAMPTGTPSTSDSGLPHSKAVSPYSFYGDFLHKMFRPEFLRNAYCSRHPLSSDAFSRFGRVDADTHNQDVIDAFRYFCEHTLPSVLKMLNAANVETSTQLRELLHQHGVNMRFLGVLWYLSGNSHVKNALFQEMICRGLKDVTRRWARLCPTTHDEGLVVARLAAALVCPSPPTKASSARTPSSLLYEDTLPSVLYGKFFGGYERLVEPSQAVPPRGTYNGTILRKLNEACTSIRASCATSSRHSPPSDQNATDADTSTYADQLTRRLLCVVGISPHTALSSPPVLRAYLSDLTSHSSLRATDDIKAPSPNAVPCPCVALTLNVKVKNVKPTPFVALEKAEEGLLETLRIREEALGHTDPSLLSTLLSLNDLYMMWSKAADHEATKDALPMPEFDPTWLSVSQNTSCVDKPLKPDNRATDALIADSEEKKNRQRELRRNASSGKPAPAPKSFHLGDNTHSQAGINTTHALASSAANGSFLDQFRFYSYTQGLKVIQHILEIDRAHGIANVHQIVGRFYAHFDHQVTCERLFSRHLAALKEMSFDNRSLEVADTWRDLGVVYLRMDRAEKGLQLLQRALSVQQLPLGGSSARTAVPQASISEIVLTLRQIAHAYGLLGKDSQRYATAMTALELLAVSSSSVLVLLHALGFSGKQRRETVGKFPLQLCPFLAAKVGALLAEKPIATDPAPSGGASSSTTTAPAHPYTLSQWSARQSSREEEVVMLLFEAGDACAMSRNFGLAKRILLRSREEAMAVLGSLHEHVGDVEQSLAKTAAGQRDLVAAIHLLQRALCIYQRSLRPDHRKWGAALAALAAMYEALKDRDRQVKLLQMAYSSLAVSYNLHHASVVRLEKKLRRLGIAPVP